MSVTRTLVRLINHHVGLDTHAFIYGKKAEKISAVKEAFDEISIDKAMPEGVEWIDEVLERAQKFGEKLYGSYHQEGWLVLIRIDQVEATPSNTVANDNQVIPTTEKQVV